MSLRFSLAVAMRIFIEQKRKQLSVVVGGSQLGNDESICWCLFWDAQGFGKRPRAEVVRWLCRALLCGTCVCVCVCVCVCALLCAVGLRYTNDQRVCLRDTQ